MASPSRGPPVLASDWLSWPLPVTKTYSRPAGQVPRTPPHGNAMDRKLLDILVCPATRQPLSLLGKPGIDALNRAIARSEEHTSELHSLMRTSYAVFCLNKTTITQTTIYNSTLLF